MLFAATWMALESIMLSAVSHTEKDRYCMISLTCGILKKYNKIVNVTKKTQTHRYKNIVVFFLLFS